jgi:hypothetical protein
VGASACVDVLTRKISHPAGILTPDRPDYSLHSGVPRIFLGWGEGFLRIQLRTEGRQNGDRGRQPPGQGFRSICKWVNPVFLLGRYGCVFHGTGNSAQLCQNFGIFFFGGGGWTPSVRHWAHTHTETHVNEKAYYELPKHIHQGRKWATYSVTRLVHFWNGRFYVFVELWLGSNKPHASGKE